MLLVVGDVPVVGKEKPAARAQHPHRLVEDLHAGPPTPNRPPGSTPSPPSPTPDGPSAPSRPSNRPRSKARRSTQAGSAPSGSSRYPPTFSKPAAAPTPSSSTLRSSTSNSPTPRSSPSPAPSPPSTPSPTVPSKPVPRTRSAGLERKLRHSNAAVPPVAKQCHKRSQPAGAHSNPKRADQCPLRNRLTAHLEVAVSTDRGRPQWVCGHRSWHPGLS